MNASMIESVPLFGVLNEAQRALIGERMVLEKYAADRHLFTQGEPGEKLFLIKSGWVRLMGDQSTVLANLSQGSLMGDADVLLGHNHSTTAEAVTDVEAWTLGLEDLVDVVSRQPEIGLKLNKVYRGTIVPLIRYLVERRLRTIPELDDLPDQVLVTMAGRLCAHDAKPGDVLFSTGQAPTSLYIVDEGKVALSGPGGVVGESGPGDLVAERNLLLGRAHTLTARVLSQGRLWELSAGDLERLSGLYPDLAAALSRVLQSRLEASDISRAVNLLRATPIFQSLPAAALDELAAKMVSQIAPNGSRICDPDTPADAMFLVEGGSVELLNRRGESQGSIHAGAYFGEAGLRGGSSYGFGALARGTTTLWVLSQADFAAVAAHQPAVQAALNEQLTSEQEEAAEHFAERHLRRLTLFANMTDEQLRDVANYLRPEHFRPGQLIYQRGQPGEALYLVEQGRISVQTRQPNGSVRTVATMGPGDFVGETALLTGEPHATDTFAQNEVSAWALTRGDFEALLNKYPVLAVNLSRVLSYRLRESNEQAAGLATEAAAAVPVPVAAEPAPPPARIVRQAPAPRVAARPAAARVRPARPGGSPLAWFTGLSTGGKIRLLVIAALVIWLVFVSAASLVQRAIATGSSPQPQSVRISMLESSMLVAMADSSAVINVSDAPTWTPWPTETPIPSPTSTATPVPTATDVPPTATAVPPTATAAPTATRVPPTATSRPVAAVRQAQPAAVVAAAQAPAPAPAPAKSSNRYTLKEVRHLSACENKGKHNIFIQVVDPAGNPVDGVVLVQASLDLGQIFEVKVSGDKGPGKAEFDMYKQGRYAVFVSENRQSPTSSDVTPPLGSVRDFNDNVWPEEMCADGGGNTMGHNSFSVVFVRN